MRQTQPQKRMLYACQFSPIQMMSIRKQRASGAGFHVTSAATIIGANTMLRNTRGEESQKLPIKP
jgi:hypothetical protein